MTDLVETPLEQQATTGDLKLDLHDPQLYINRELSLLEFHRRVLEEAQDEANPLLERVKFLSIVGSNLDEFFMVRVTGLRKQVDAGVIDVSADGLPPMRVLAEIRKVALQLMTQARDCLNDDLMPQLRRAGIHVMDYQALTDRQKAGVDSYFDEVISKVITPLAFDPGHPFPHISNLSLNLAVVIRDEEGRERFARVKVPKPLMRLVPIKRSSGGLRKDGTPPQNHYFVWVEQLIAANLRKLFPGMEIVESHPFRVTRDADMVIQELEAADLLETIEQSVRQRRFGSVTRLTVNDAMPTRIRDILIENLEMDRRDVYTVTGPLGLSDLISLHSLDRPDLKDPPLRPTIPPELKTDQRESELFNAIRKQDLLVHHPYDSFRPVVDFLRLAAADPDVLAIKQTLYRVGRNSPVVQALLEARENGKEVAVLVELKARFDEESNIGWARTLEKEGVHVIYGLLGLKTHSKIALVVRREGEHIRRYIHLATGNYNAVTAQLYEDIGMFTCDEDIGADATDLFNYLTGYSAKKDYRKLLVAPVNLRSRMEALIEREIAHVQRGGCGHLIFKMNALVDPRMIRKLYQASQAGVKVDLIVRGICCLRPGLPGISDNIRVISVVGRFLEHSRIYYFCNGGNEEIYLGSADLMPRNINWRVEVLFPVQDRRLVRYLTDDVLKTYLAANAKTRILRPDGTYQHLKPEPGEQVINPQEWLIQYHQRLKI
jgi:polyphosphate kinase